MLTIGSWIHELISSTVDFKERKKKVWGKKKKNGFNPPIFSFFLKKFINSFEETYTMKKMLKLKYEAFGSKIWSNPYMIKWKNAYTGKNINNWLLSLMKLIKNQCLKGVYKKRMYTKII